MHVQYKYYVNLGCGTSKYNACVLSARGTILVAGNELVDTGSPESRILHISRNNSDGTAALVVFKRPFPIKINYSSGTTKVLHARS
jgi:hypothetical protein